MKTLGQKIKEQRTKAGLSQEQLAEKLFVSRQAITKWENDKGSPDISNLQALSQLFEVSVDQLLDDTKEISNHVIKEAIDLSQYEKLGSLRAIQDSVVKAKYPDAKITEVVRSKELSLKESILDVLTLPGLIQTADSIENYNHNYLVEYPNKTLLVTVDKEFIESREINVNTSRSSFVIGKNKYRKANTKF